MTTGNRGDGRSWAGVADSFALVWVAEWGGEILPAQGGSGVGQGGFFLVCVELLSGWGWL
ncbi:MAG: hypothetical protein OXG09_03285 [Chloroflexi bacterium]|nr:hypothetical protein [Chloroflexota bacterium]